jgi:hypothetical protein
VRCVLDEVHVPGKLKADTIGRLRRATVDEEEEAPRQREEGGGIGRSIIAVKGVTQASRWGLRGTVEPGERNNCPGGDRSPGAP